MTVTSALAGNALPLVLASAFYHPDGTLRTRLRARLERQVEAARPSYSISEVQAVLQGVTGTEIEPFVLNRVDLALATLLIRLAFSEEYRQTRFRVVSRETLGAEGGLVLTNNLRGYYVERYAPGRHHHVPGGEFSSWFVAPATAPRSAVQYAKDSRHARAVLRLDQTGVRLTLPWYETVGDQASLARQLQEHSRVRGQTQPLARIGLRVDVTAGGVEVRAGSPEAILRLTALGAEGALLVLDPGESDGAGSARPRAFVRLALPADEPVALPAIVTTTSCYPYSWVKVDLSLALELSRQERLAIADWLPPHDTWVDDLLEELL